jgi:patatin-like phospholipase/acyl hydrolase
MGKVVQLDGPDGRPRGSKGRRGRGRADKTALVLGGGGFTGGVYEMGALRAFDLLAVNRTVNDFDIYVGTSAGAFVASMVANGVTPEEMFRERVAEDPAAPELPWLRGPAGRPAAAGRRDRPPPRREHR